MIKTCANCIHRELCNVHGYIDADECGCFKDKSQYIDIYENSLQIGMIMWQFMVDELREFIKTKTKLDPVYSYNPSITEARDKMTEASDFFIKFFTIKEGGDTNE